MPEETAKKTPHDILRIVLRRWRLFVLSFFLFAIAVMWISPHVLTRTYTSTAEIKRSTLPATDKILKGDVRRLQLMFVNSLSGREAIEQIVDDWELPLLKGVPRDQGGNLTDEGEKRRQEIVMKLQKNVSVVVPVEGETVDMIRLEVTHSDPDLAEQIANKLIDNYRLDVLKDLKKRLTDSRDFLKSKVTAVRDLVIDKVNNKVEFETKYAAMRLDKPGFLQSQIDEIGPSIEVERRSKRRAEQRLARLESELQTIRASITQPSSTTPKPITRTLEKENPELGRLKSDLLTCQENLDVALKIRHMTDKHPDVIALRARIEMLEKRIEKTTETVMVTEKVSVSDPANPARKAKSPEEAVKEQAVSVQQEKIDMATTDIDRLEERRKKLESAMLDFASVRRKYETKLEELKYEREKLKRWQRELEEVEIALGAEQLEKRTSIELSYARRLFLPSSPKLMRILGFALAGGLAFGGGLAFLCNWMDRTIGSTEDAMKYFALPVHGVIGEITTPRDRLWKWIRNWVVSPIVALILGCCLLVGVVKVHLWLAKSETPVVDFLYQNVMTLIPG